MSPNDWQWAPRKYFQSYVTPREFKKGARDIPFGQGAKALHVDGVNGDDHSDGESWKTAFKTIQNGAVDHAESWTDIFVKAGTYAENVTISDHRIRLEGEDEETTFIDPPTGHALTVSANQLDLSGFTIKVTAALCKCINLVGNRNIVHDCVFDGAISSDQGLTGLGDYNVAHHCRCTADIEAFFVAGSFWEVYDCHAEGATSSRGFHIAGDNFKLHDNFIKNCNSGICLHSASADCGISHNNLIGNTTQVEDHGSNNKSRENYFDDHTNIDNGFGIATEPYSFTGGIDSRPVICRNGWNSISIQRALLRKKTGLQATQAATDANGTSWVDLKSISPTTSDLELHRIQMTVAGAWAGTAKYRIIVGSDKVYPFGNDKNISTGVLETFIFPINVQINETVKIQFRSDNAGDGAGETVSLDQLDYSAVV